MGSRGSFGLVFFLRQSMTRIRVVGLWVGSLYTTLFRITKLDAQSVLAEPLLDDVCIRQTLTFDRVAKAVTFTRTKISHEGICAIVQNAPVTLFLGDPL
jgi:hypothetical protein